MARGFFKKAGKSISKGLKKGKSIAKGVHRGLKTVRRVASVVDKATGGIAGEVLRSTPEGQMLASAVKDADKVAKIGADPSKLKHHAQKHGKRMLKNEIRKRLK
tara:strand:+ start:1717 stop:2028 length:312 start_codon:yes stop_codon:yes gene_type:complete